MNGCLTLEKKKHTKLKQIRQISGLARRGQSQRVYYHCNEKESPTQCMGIGGRAL